MSTWAAIAVTDLDGYLMSVQLDAIRTGGMRMGQADPFSIVMPDVCNTVRNVIANRGKPISATANAVPNEARTATIWLIIDALQTRIPGLIVTADQKRHVDNANQLLKDMAEPGFAVSVPQDPMQPNVNIGAGIEVVRSSCRQGVSLRSMDGLL